MSRTGFVVGLGGDHRRMQAHSSDAFPIPRTKPRGLHALAFSGTLVLPGLGHVLTGSRQRGFAWMACWLVVSCLNVLGLIIPSLIPSLIVLLPLQLVVGVIALIDALRDPRKTGRRGWVSTLVRYFGAVALLASAILLSPNFILARFIRQHFVEAFTVHGGSMQPALLPGDLFLAHKNLEPVLPRWSIVTIKHPTYGFSTAVTRVVGLPGEEVEIQDGGVLINGELMSLPPGIGPYTHVTYSGWENHELRGKVGAGCSGNAIQLEYDEYFVLGDNSENSLDARHWEILANGHQLGALPRSSIVGKATAVYWPPGRWALLKD